VTQPPRVLASSHSNRLPWGLNAVLAQLGATGPWRELLEELLALPVEPA